MKFKKMISNNPLVFGYIFVLDIVFMILSHIFSQGFILSFVVFILFGTLLFIIYLAWVFIYYLFVYLYQAYIRDKFNNVQKAKKKITEEE